MEDGTIAYYNINYYEHFLIPNGTYVKAYRLGDTQEELDFLELDISDNDSLKDAIADHSRWVLVKGGDGSLIMQLVEENTRYIKVLEEDGTTGFYEIRYISSSQERVN